MFRQRYFIAVVQLLRTYDAVKAILAWANPSQSHLQLAPTTKCCKYTCLACGHQLFSAMAVDHAEVLTDYPTLSGGLPDKPFSKGGFEPRRRHGVAFHGEHRGVFARRGEIPTYSPDLQRTAGEFVVLGHHDT